MNKTASHSHHDGYTVSMDSPACLKIDRVGAKASRLAQMGRQGFPIPKGFVVTTDAFRAFCEHNHLFDNIDHGACDAALQADIIHADVPPILEAEIDRCMHALSFESYAVRSSATLEDGSVHSMAGQFDTFLNISKERLLDSVKACWASMFGPAVRAYAQHKNITAAPRMGVLIQEQIDPLVAGVLFTMDPVTLSADHLIVEWVKGLGDKLVSGLEAPQRFYVRRGGPVQVPSDDLPPSLSTIVHELVAHALNAEKLFNGPLDIEWCVSSTGLVLLQARPITGVMGAGQVLWTNVNMVENFPDVLTPFSWSMVDTFYRYYTRHMLRLFGWSERRLFEARSIVNHFTGIQAGRIYYNLSNWYAAAHRLPMGRLLKRLLDSFIGQNIPVDQTNCADDKWAAKRRRCLMHCVGLGLRMVAMCFTAGRHIKRYEEQFYRHREHWRRSAYHRLTLAELLERLDSIVYGFVKIYYYNPAMVDLLAAVFPGGLKLMVKQWLGRHVKHTELVAVQLMQGVGVKSIEPAHMIQAMSDSIAADPHLRQLLMDGDDDALEHQLPDALMAGFDEFMFRFGNRCYHDCTMATPTFEERHDLFWDLVRKYLRADAETGSAGKQGDHAAHPVLKEAMGHLGLVRRWMFRAMVKNARRAIGLRERSRIIRSLLFGEIRQVVRAMGKTLSEKGHLSSADDVFFLHWSEIKAIAFGQYQFPETLPAVIHMRKQALEANQAVDPPSFFVREASTYLDIHCRLPSVQTAPACLFKGVAVAGGRVTAKAKIILDPVNHNTLEPGEILVAQATDPGWTPLFQIAGGLILEKGGMLSHGAIVAREFGIPAIANVVNATSLIKDGQIIRMNGDTGEIRIVSRMDEAG